MEDINKIKEEIFLYQQLRFEQDKKKKERIKSNDENELNKLLKSLKIEKVNKDEPNELSSIMSLSDFNKDQFKVDNYLNRLKGAIVGRFAGCLLGVPVEGYSIKYMKKLAKEGNTPFPPTEYWHKVDKLDWIQYGVDPRKNYTIDGINAVLVDDDITYTVLNLLLLEKYGKDYSLHDVASLWLDILPYACTAEDRALQELKKGTKPELVANDNPFIEWIGAAIRADAFGYIFAGRPYEAAVASYNDAYLTHRRNGIYGEMFLAASIASSFSLKPLEAIKQGIKYIPKNSRLYKDISWALSYEQKKVNFVKARKLIDRRFKGMNSVHTNNNMCAIVFICIIAKENFDKAISTAVAMGLDNDCTAASIGSMYGAYLGISNINEKWYSCFNNKVHTYLKGYENITLDYLFDLGESLYKRNK